MQDTHNYVVCYSSCVQPYPFVLERTACMHPEIMWLYMPHTTTCTQCIRTSALHLIGYAVVYQSFVPTYLNRRVWKNRTITFYCEYTVPTFIWNYKPVCSHLYNNIYDNINYSKSLFNDAIDSALHCTALIEEHNSHTYNCIIICVAASKVNTWLSVPFPVVTN